MCSKAEKKRHFFHVTRGFHISGDPDKDNLTPQETTKQDPPEVGADGTDLSCPGSSVVAGSFQGSTDLDPADAGG